MSPTRKLHDLGQSLWLDNITRDMLDSGTLSRYIEELSVTGLTSNPTIFEKALKESAAYDASILGRRGTKPDEELFVDLAIEDIARAADLFRPVWERTNGVDGYVSLEVSPLFAYDTQSTLREARRLHERAARPNVFIKIPGTREGLAAIEGAIFAGVPINVTLLFSREQYLAAADAYLRGIERRIAAGLSPDVPSVASLFVSRWDVAVSREAPAPLRNRLAIAIAERTFDAYRDLLDSPRMRRVCNFGARPQRLLWASTGTKDPEASPLLYVDALVAPLTVNTMPEATLLALAKSSELGSPLTSGGRDTTRVLADFARAGIDTAGLAGRLQQEGADAFVKSWNALLEGLGAKRARLQKTG
jgi:transaldolase